MITLVTHIAGLPDEIPMREDLHLDAEYGLSFSDNVEKLTEDRFRMLIKACPGTHIECTSQPEAACVCCALMGFDHAVKIVEKNSEIQTSQT